MKYPIVSYINTTERKVWTRRCYQQKFPTVIRESGTRQLILLIVEVLGKETKVFPTTFQNKWILHRLYKWNK